MNTSRKRNKVNSQPKIRTEQYQPILHKINRPNTLINKLQFSLANFIKSNKTKITLTGTKRFTDKTGEYYLKNVLVEKKNANKVSKKLSLREPMNLVECINRCKGIQLLITKADKVITKLPENSLTPIPNINKQKIKNKFENKELANAERTAVYIRRLEYSTGMIKTKKKDNYDINKIIFIQEWWRIMNYIKNLKEDNIICINTNSNRIKRRNQSVELKSSTFDEDSYRTLNGIKNTLEQIYDKNNNKTSMENNIKKNLCIGKKNKDEKKMIHSYKDKRVMCRTFENMKLVKRANNNKVPSITSIEGNTTIEESTISNVNNNDKGIKKKVNQVLLNKMNKIMKNKAIDISRYFKRWKVFICDRKLKCKKILIRTKQDKIYFKEKNINDMIHTLQTIINNHNKQKGFDAIKERANANYLKFLLCKLIGANNAKIELIAKRERFNKLKEIVNDMNIKDKLREIFDSYSLSDDIHQYLISNPLKLILKALRSKRRLKKKAISNNVVMNKKKEMINIALFDQYKDMFSNWLLNKTKSDFLNRIYRLYIYIKLDKMFNCIKTIMTLQIKQEIGKMFLSSMYSKLRRNSYFNYNGKKSSEFHSPLTHFSFKQRGQLSNKNKIHLISDKKISNRLIPYFVAYLNNLRNKSRKEALYKLISNDKSIRFVDLYKSFCISQLLPQKKSLIDSLDKESKEHDVKCTSMLSLYKLLHHKIISHLCTSLKQPNHLYKLIYLLRITIMHKSIAEQRCLRELLRKWRFDSFIKQMARKKLNKMYNNFCVSYLQMASEVFGEEDTNPSVLMELDRFNSNIYNDDANDAKKYVKKVEKKYVFNSNLINDDI